MKYLCLIYENEQAWATTPQSEADVIMREYFAFTDDYTKSGQVLGGNALQPTHTATTVRVRNGKVSTTDGRSPRRASSSAATIWSRPRI